MKILAIEKEIESTDWSNADQILKEEARQAYRLVLAGSMREMYFTEEHIAVLILEADNLDRAREILGTLPLVKAGMIEFDVMELRPYTGFGRIMEIE